MGERTDPAGNDRPTRRWMAGLWRLAPLMACAAVVAFHLATLLRTPAPFVDDAWYASRAWAIIQTGRAYGSLDAGVFDRFPGYWTILPALYAWLESLAIRALGLSLFSVRLVSLIGGLVLAGAVFAIGRHLGGKALGWVAALLTLLSSAFLQSAHMARPDIWAAAIGFAATALCITGTHHEFPIRHILGGLCVGLAFEVHPNAAVYGPAILAMYFVDRGWGALRSPRFWGFGAGAALGLFVYAALHVLPYPQSYLALTRDCYGSWRMPPAFMLDPAVWSKSVASLAGLLLPAYQLCAPWLLIAPIVLWCRGGRAGRQLLWIAGTLTLSFVALVRYKINFDAIFITPACDLLLAHFLIKLWGKAGASVVSAIPCPNEPGALRHRVAPSDHRWQSLMAGVRRVWNRLGERSRPCLAGLLKALVFATLIGSLLLNILPVFRQRVDDFDHVLGQVRQAVPESATVMGSQTYWFGIPDRKYLSWEQIIYYQRYFPGSTIEDALRALHPDMLLFDEHLDRFVADDPAKLDPYSRFLALDKGEVEGFLRTHCRLVTEFETHSWGSIRFYQVNWG